MFRHEFVRRKYDPSSDMANGVFYDPKAKTVFTVSEYECDEDCDYEAGFKSFVIGEFDLADPHGERYNDANYNGYKTLAELMEDEFTTDCWVIGTRWYEPATLSELCRDLLEEEGVDLHLAVTIIDEECHED